MRAAYEEALEIAREIGKSSMIAQALFDLSFAPAVEGDWDGVEHMLRKSLAEAEGADPALLAQIWRSLGLLEGFRGNIAGAIEPTRRAVDTQRELGNRSPGR